MSLAALPDFRLTIDDQIAEGGVVVTHWSAKGTQHCPLFGIPPTSRSVTAVAVHIDHLADGRIIDQWEEFDTHRGCYANSVCALPILR
jgi:predicted ester cyclase